MRLPGLVTIFAFTALAQDAGFYQRRATSRFLDLDIAGSVADFDRANQLSSTLAPENWQRGIALYYAGRFDDCRRQFELHRTVNPEDVENAAWHFLCAVRSQGIGTARRSFIPIRSDSRIPMMTVHRLFAGQASEEDVFRDARAGDPVPEALRVRLFYAELYVGLYLEALGKDSDSLHHMEKAVGLRGDHYMWEVARVHYTLRAKLKKNDR